MGKINAGRVVLGGLVAGLVLNVVDYVVNGVWLMNDWNAALTALGKPAMNSSGIAVFVTLDFLIGIVLVWLYAAIRPRFGAGPRTAAIAGFVMWLLLSVFMGVVQLPDGLFPVKLILAPALVALVSYQIAAMVGGRLYAEAA